MNEWLLALLPQYGFLLLGGCTFLSCLALPIPASLLMLATGGFIAAGDLSLPMSAGAALIGAMVGDQTGYFAGRWVGTDLVNRLGSRAVLFSRATALLASKGGIAVFLSRWLVSALGPYVNVAAGAARQPWAIFTGYGLAGEIVWISLYVGLGYGFTGNLEAASSMAWNLLGLLAAGAVAVGLALWLILTLRAERAEKSARGRGHSKHEV